MRDLPPTVQKILIIGDDMRAFLACARSLGRLGHEVHAAPFNWSSAALKSKYIKSKHCLPRLVADPDRWVRGVIELQARHNFDLILPCDERGLLPLQSVDRKERNFKLAEPGHKAMSVLFDKHKTRELARELGEPVARGVGVDDQAALANAIKRFGLPLMVKARSSYTERDLDKRGKVLCVSDQNSRNVAEKLVGSGEQLLAEEYFGADGDADGIGLSVAARNGNVVAAFQHRRMIEKPGGGSSSVRKSEAVDKDMLAAVEKLSKLCELNGIAMFEFRQKRSDGDWILLEVNARPWGSLSLPLALGVDFPRMMLEIHCGPIQDYASEYRYGVVGRNMLLSVAHALGDKDNSITYRLNSVFRSTFGHVILVMMGKEQSDSFVFDDMGPGIYEFFAVARRMLGRLRWRVAGKPERRAYLLNGSETPRVRKS